MSDKSFPDKETRREQAFRRLGTREPVCVTCAFIGPPAAYELAHIAPRKFHDDVAVLCSNCHRAQSDAEKDFPYAPETDNPKMETIAHYLLGLSEFSEMIAQTQRGFGEWLLEQARYVRPHDADADQ